MKDINDRLDAQDQMLRDIKGALTGDSFGNTGLVGRVKNTEEQITAHNTRYEQLSKEVADHTRRFWFISVLGSAIWATIVAFKEQIFPHK